MNKTYFAIYSIILIVLNIGQFVHNTNQKMKIKELSDFKINLDEDNFLQKIKIDSLNKKIEFLETSNKTCKLRLNEYQLRNVEQIEQFYIKCILNNK